MQNWFLKYDKIKTKPESEHHFYFFFSRRVKHARQSVGSDLEKKKKKRKKKKKKYWKFLTKNGPSPQPLYYLKVRVE